MFKAAAILVLIGIGATGVVQAQPAPALTQQTQTIKRTPLQKFEVPGTNFDTVIGIAEIAPNVSIGRHIHPGPESGFLLEGEFTLLVEGEAPLSLKAGQSYKVPSGAIHDAKTGTQGAKVIATYVVERGKPIASPAQ